jgi:hypothetical protein
MPRFVPTRDEAAAMTTRVSPPLRDIYKVMSVELRSTMGELQLVALRSMIARFEGLSKVERRRLWETIKNELPADDEGERDD